MSERSVVMHLIFSPYKNKMRTTFFLYNNFQKKVFVFSNVPTFLHIKQTSKPGEKLFKIFLTFLANYDFGMLWSLTGSIIFIKIKQ